MMVSQAERVDAIAHELRYSVIQLLGYPRELEKISLNDRKRVLDLQATAA
eukprot:m.264271 g.264271  ORF g.264271 m.264271 type:complete len:50 (-) comp15610_c1_seq17:937-1086(-)